MDTQPEVGTALVAPSDDAIQSIKSQGRVALAFRKERNDLARAMGGMTWGNVNGSGMSMELRSRLATFCQVTGAEPLTQIDILGGKVYTNGNFWTDVMVSHPHYIEYTQRSLTEASEKILRDLAAEHRTAYEGLREADAAAAAAQLARALEIGAEVSQIVEARARWTPRAGATAIVETTIRRYSNQAPLEAIKAGKFTMEEAEAFVIEVKECNWAGGKQGDPVGNAESEKSARTRSLRRTCVRAFSAWLKKYEVQIKRAEEALEAEWEFVQDEPAPATTGPQAVLGSGEAEAGDLGTAKALPVRGQEQTSDGYCAACGGEGCVQCSAAHIPEAEVVEEEPEPEAPAWDPTDARKRLFATLRDCGITEKKRKAWQKKNKLPESSKDWGKEEYDRAQTVLMGPLIEKVDEGCEKLNMDIGDLSLSVIGKDYPDFAKDYNALIAALDIRLGASTDAEEAEDAGL
jgi:hypothetical protein